MTPLENQIKSLLEAVEAYSTGHGGDQSRAALAATDELRLWLHYFATHHPSVCARELLAGARAAILESIGCISLGIGRGAISAIRLQIDLLLGFTFFSDHPKEWERVEQTGDGFMLKSDIHKYLDEMTPGFKNRLQMIESSSGLSLSEIYRVLSAHIHGQSPYTMPHHGKLEELVLSVETLDSIVELQRRSTLATSNYLTAVYAPQWTALPPEVVKRVRESLSEKQKPLFFV
jgi:hypothetical protein